MKRPVIILGGGGHARVLIDLLRLTGVPILGLIYPTESAMKLEVNGYRWLGDDEAVLQHSPSGVELVNGLGTIDVSPKRRQIFESFKHKGYVFMTLVHPSAVVAPDVSLSEGAQIMAGVVIQTGTVIGENTIINTRASVDHDCKIGSHVHIAPGVILSGGVHVGNGCHLGTGAVVIQGIRIKDTTFIKAGSLVSASSWEPRAVNIRR